MKRILLSILLALASAGAWANCTPPAVWTGTGCSTPSAPGSSSSASSDSAAIGSADSSSDSAAISGSDSSATGGDGTAFGGSSSSRAGGGGGASVSGGRAVVLGISRSAPATAPLPRGCEWVRITQTVDGGWIWGLTPDRARGGSDPSLCAAWAAYQEAQAQCWHRSARLIFAAFARSTSGVDVPVPDGLADGACPPKSETKPIAVEPKAEVTPPAPIAVAPPKRDKLAGKRVRYSWCACKARPADAVQGVERIVNFPNGVSVTYFLRREVR